MGKTKDEKQGSGITQVYTKLYKKSLYLFVYKKEKKMILIGLIIIAYRICI